MHVQLYGIYTAEQYYSCCQTLVISLGMQQKLICYFYELGCCFYFSFRKKKSSSVLIKGECHLIIKRDIYKGLQLLSCTKETKEYNPLENYVGVALVIQYLLLIVFFGHK